MILAATNQGGRGWGVPARGALAGNDSNKKKGKMGRILIVDDEPNMRQTVASNLRQDGHEISEAVSVDEARSNLLANDFDAVLTRQPMPDGEGLTVLDAARENMLKMLDAKDAASRDSAYSEVKKATESLNSGLAEMLATAADADRAKLNEFKGIWQAFISTRDTELVPAAQSGDAEKIASAKQKAGAVQKERLGKMKEVLTSLGAN